MPGLPEPELSMTDPQIGSMALIFKTMRLCFRILGS